MKDFVTKILNEYQSAKSQPFVKHPFIKYICTSVPDEINKILNNTRYIVKGSVGQGNWAIVPWVAIFDEKITNKAGKGVYIVYLLSADGNTLYLTLNQGCTELKNKYGKNEAVKKMRDVANECIKELDSKGFLSDEKINLHCDKGLGYLYEKGTIFYKGYQKNNVPSEQILRTDLEKMIQIYQDYYIKIFAPKTSNKSNNNINVTANIKRNNT